MATVGPKQGGLWLARKNATAGLLSALLPAPLLAPLPLDRPLTVGFLRFDRRVGEVLLQTPIFAAYKTARPNDRVVAIVHPKMVRVLANQPGIDAVVAFAWRGFPVLPESWRVLQALRGLALDVVVDCSDPTIFSVGHMLAARLTRARWRVGFNRGAAAAHHGQLVDVATPVHEATARARLLMPFGITAGPQLRFVPHPKSPVLLDGQDVVELLRAQPEGHVVVCPGGRLGWRRAGAEHFGVLCRALQRHGRTVWLAPGPGEEELVAQVAQHAPGARVLPQTDLDQLAAVMAAAGRVVCNNSGTMHLSVAAGARTLGLFVAMDPGRWGHGGAGHRMVVLDPGAPDATQHLEAELDAWLAAA
jgi:heptosyltransferase-3